MEKVVPFRTGYGSGLCAAGHDGSFLFVLFRLSSGADGHVSGMIDYDVFGEPVTENGVFAGASGGSGVISALVFAYAGKPYDPVTGLSDYGFRDYAPGLARFTTVDPIRDGSNWYAYCNADPVNYVDLWGLTASDSGGSSGQYAKWNKFVSDFDNSFYSIINGDFGLDQFANGARAWSNGDYGNAVLYGLSGVAEAALDMALAYTVAKAFGAFVGVVSSYVSSWFTGPEAGSVTNRSESIFEYYQEGAPTIGHYPEYVDVSQTVNGKIFQVPGEIFDKWTKTEQWIANKKFLDRAISRSEPFNLATKLENMRPNSFYEEEVKYLLDNSYKLNESGTMLLPPPK